MALDGSRCQPAGRAVRSQMTSSLGSANYSFSFAFGVALPVLSSKRLRRCEVSHFFLLVANANVFIFKITAV